MKKLLLITLALTMPQAFAASVTTGKSSEPFEQQRKEAEQQAMDRIKKVDEERASKLEALKQEALKLSGPLLPLRTPALRVIEIIKGLPEITTLPIKEEPLKDQVGTITIADFKGLLGALNAAASGERLLGLKLHPQLLKIYQNPTIQALYKELVAADEKNPILETPESKGNIHSNIVRIVQSHKFTDGFARDLFTVLFEGKTINDLVDLILDNLTLKVDAFKQLQKGTEATDQKKFFEAEKMGY